MTRGLAVRLAVAVALGAAVTAAWLPERGYFWPQWVWFGLGTVLLGEVLLRRALRVPPGPRRWLAVDAAAVSLSLVVDLVVYVMTGGGLFWPAFSLVGLSAILGLHAWYVARLPDPTEAVLTARVDTLTRTRTAALDTQAAELRRIERDLHDGAQARIVSLAMSLGLAEDAVRGDPDQALRLLAEARAGATAALEDLRTVVRGIAPSILVDRGLVGAVAALALDLAVPIDVSGEVAGQSPGELPVAVETALYFAVVECLTNAVKHSGATRIEVRFGSAAGVVVAEVRDDGTGGADPAGSGLAGIARRLETFDGRVEVSSPSGGPTVVRLSAPVSAPAAGTPRTGR